MFRLAARPISVPAGTTSWTVLQVHLLNRSIKSNLIRHLHVQRPLLGNVVA